jgi:hypothetical protein
LPSTLEAVDVNFFPNPGSDKVYIQTNDIIEQVTILNTTGVEMKSYFGNLKEIDVTDLSEGYYFVSVKTLRKRTLRPLIVQ